MKKTGDLDTLPEPDRSRAIAARIKPIITSEVGQAAFMKVDTTGQAMEVLASAMTAYNEIAAPRPFAFDDFILMLEMAGNLRGART